MTTTAQPANEPVLLEKREGALVTLTLNRPERLNALNPALGAALAGAMKRAGADDSVRCVIISGAGRGFCAGGDIGVLREVRLGQSPEALDRLLQSGIDLVLAIHDMPKPVVAAVNGIAAGGGANVALACDIRIGSEHAAFAQSFAKIGLFPDFGGTWTLPRLAGTSRALELLMTGETVHAQEALRIGLLSRIVTHDTLLDEARATAEHLLAAPPIAVRGIKQALYGTDRAALERALHFEAEMQRRCFASADSAEGLNAFVEKRKPHFKGS
jgi:2-(1,2-epoxy-1,2-dihydrophenyl)acetyl-CoA isomerase